MISQVEGKEDMERVIELIREWHEQEKIEERKRKTAEVYRDVFGIEPLKVEVVGGKVVARGYFDYHEIKEKLGEEVFSKLLDIANAHVDATTLKSLILKVGESEEEESDWKSYWTRSYDDYLVVRKKYIKGYEVKMIIETPVTYDC